MKHVPKGTNLAGFLEELGKTDVEHSRSLVERISSSGDTTGTPFYHWRWKLKCLADLVVWPTETEHVATIMKLATKYSVPVTQRGAGSCYYGSGAPSMGGVVMDTKRMRRVQVDEAAKTVKVQAGTCFSALMDELDRHGLELGCYPTSALTSTLGGWVGTGGEMGIGTVQVGPYVEQVVALTVVTPAGEVLNLTDPQQFKVYFNTNGSFGVVTELTLKVHPKTQKVPMYFGFNGLAASLEALKDLVKETDPFVVRLSDVQHEARVSGFSIFETYLFVVLNGRNKPIEEDLERVKAVIARHGGEYLGEELSERTWFHYLRHEMQIKLETPVQMLQQLIVDLDHAQELIEYFERLCVERNLNHCYYVLVNRDLRVRLVLYTLTDNDYWVHFLASKSVIHKVVKRTYALGGRIYTYGLQNTIYLKKFEPEKWKQFLELKEKVDPGFVLNPLKLTESKISFLRVDLMFELTAFWRKLATKLGKAREILTVDIPHNARCREKYLGKKKREEA
ncbi:MAG: hypothetical protein Kow0069_23900 [Promethearchaeota archaeon]